MSQEETAEEQATEIIELRVEIERLRAVLQEIARGKVASDYDDLRLTAARVCGIARRAIAAAQPEEKK